VVLVLGGGRVSELEIGNAVALIAIIPKLNSELLYCRARINSLFAASRGLSTGKKNRRISRVLASAL
jgi:hypothetical protein